LFTVDADRHLRICLHPKLVKSKDEVRPEHDRDMKEANLLSLVTLRPTDDGLLPITIQPLICSDVLNLQTDDPNNHPLEAVTSHRSCFRTLHSDHVDIVSVATCTGTSRVGTDTGQLEWNQKFRDAFRHSAADDQCSRHQFAAFVLSNYRYRSTIPNETPGGLSGVFLPLPLFDDPFSEHVSKAWNILCHRTRGTGAGDVAEDERWEGVETFRKNPSIPHVLGYVVALEPNISRDSAAVMFGLTLTRLPRDANRWQRRGGVSDFRLYQLISFSENGETRFQFKPLKPRGDL
jgi:hypothetical protein